MRFKSVRVTGIPAAVLRLSTPAGIAGNDYNLNIPRYVDTFEEEEETDLMAVRAERG